MDPWTGKESAPLMRFNTWGGSIMSMNMWRTRLYYDEHLSCNKGAAKSEDVEVRLHSAPSIPGLPARVTFIDFAPETRCYELRESAQNRREMHPPEIEAVNKWLASIVAAVRQAMSCTA